jgi:CRISPR-associated protein Cmr5
MSIQQTIDQERAALAWKAIEDVNEKPEDFKKQYASWVRSAPADVMTNGLGQTLAFMLAKGKGSDTDSAPSLLYRHLSEWVCPKMGWGQAGLLDKLIEPNSTSDVYRRATTEALTYLVWLKRFAEAVLPEVTDVGE